VAVTSADNESFVLGATHELTDVSYTYDSDVGNPTKDAATP
jgi:hypothetical protein